jgi:Xaa-Pro dipeptidase
VDLGVTVGGYSSDIQRCWFIGSDVPEPVQSAFDTVREAIKAGFRALRPGVRGYEVDQEARSMIVAAGYPEYMHALGHQVGRVAHDGGGLLGPRWARYGDRPDVPVCEGQVYTLELGVSVPEHGYLGLEEMVLVTSTGAEWISERQTAIWLSEN